MNPYIDFYQQQAESGIGTAYYGNQTGHGLGNWFGNIFRRIMPLIKSGFSTVKNELLTGGLGVLTDTLKQVPLKDSLQKRVQNMGNNLTEKAVKKVATMTGSGAYKRKKNTNTTQSAKGCKRKRSGAASTKKKSKPKKKASPKKKKKPVKRLQSKKKANKPKTSKKRTVKKKVTKKFLDIFT